MHGLVPGIPGIGLYFIMNENGERDLLERIAQGDTKAFATLFDLHSEHMGAFIFGITRSRELAEEITMDVFLKIWMARETLEDVTNFRAYLFTISRNAAISALRKLMTSRAQEARWLQDPVSQPTAGDGEKERYLTLIDEAISELSPQRQKIYLLSRREGLKYEEIAVRLGLSRFTVRAHIQQAVEFIRRYVKSRAGSQLLLLVFLQEFLKK